MDCYAVIDTNVIVAAVLSKNPDAATAGVLRAVFDGRIMPLYHADILDEYEEVLRRDKFHLREETIQKLLLAIKQYGFEVCLQSIHEILADPDDQIFYEVVMERRVLRQHVFFVPFLYLFDRGGGKISSKNKTGETIDFFPPSAYAI